MHKAVLPPNSPGQLADSLARITLSEDDEPSGATQSRGGISEELRQITSSLEDIQAFIFQVQERRHTRSVAAEIRTEVAVDRSQGDITKQTKTAIEHELRDEEADGAMDKLKAMMLDLSTKLDSTDEAIVLLSSSGTLKRRKSTESISSLISIDDAFSGMDGIGIDRKPVALRRQHDQLLRAWDDLRRNANSLASDLKGDSYLKVFDNYAKQAEELMDSLSKALETCHDAVFVFSRTTVAQRNVHPRTPQPKSINVSDGQAMNGLLSVKRNFHVKRSTYEPACDQLFVTMERGIAHNATENGTVLRRFGELHLRWQSLRERLRRMEVDLRALEGRSPRIGANNESYADLRQRAASSTPSSVQHFMRRAASPFATPDRPGSRQSRIPRPSMSNSRPRPSTLPHGEGRPSSALSFASNSTVRTFRSFNPHKTAHSKQM